jgi:hypothetical protein
MAGRTSRRPDPETLVRGLERIFVPPPEVDDALLGSAEACRLLRCEQSAVAALVAAGLPTFGPDGELLRRCDVLNLGLYSGSGRTIPEVAEAHRVRFAREPRQSWVEPRAWELAIGLGCPSERCSAGTWRLAPPCPERFGGEVREWPRSPFRLPPSRRIGATVLAKGAEAEVEDPEARRLFVELVAEIGAGRLRYQYLPPAIRRDPEAALDAGVLDCMAASLLLGRRFEAAGIPTRTRQGMLLGAAGIEHVWLEAPAADGSWAPLDPVLAALVAGSGDRAFVEFAAGSVTNRLLPWELDADQALFLHTCSPEAGGETRGGEELQVMISARPIAGQP